MILVNTSVEDNQTIIHRRGDEYLWIFTKPQNRQNSNEVKQEAIWFLKLLGGE